MFLIIDHSPLEAYADHVYYMRLACGHNPHRVRLGDAAAARLTKTWRYVRMMRVLAQVVDQRADALSGLEYHPLAGTLKPRKSPHLAGWDR
ncbi:MAG: hypothetical protein AB1453_13670 [Chloroflexota bacterium]